ncbi:MAG: hypothetical protein CME63_04625 [Halobacteriovoraceae bacterium]|nr:hypothetical protein [Halobacteriovoraceae bacterium]|tara:strand:+ start:38812 stop:39414 length:603 start_codon:yes stop_codon:yes gene_type:complete
MGISRDLRLEHQELIKLESILSHEDEIIKLINALSRKNRNKKFLEDLKGLYLIACRKLRRELNLDEVRTESELYLEAILKKQKIKFIPSIRVGHRSIDFYLIDYGIFIEVDGSIHNNENKMGKDRTRDELIHNLGCYCLVILNEDITYNAEELLKSLIQQSKKKSFTQRKNLLKKLYTHTIYKNLNLQFVNDYFSSCGYC